MRRKGKQAALISVAAAGILVILLLVAGTVLRMNTRDAGFAAAFASFITDTFAF